MNPYLVQSSERKEPEYLTTTSFLDTLRGVNFKNAEFDIIQSKFQGLTEEEQFSAYQEVNKDLFGWKYFAPYQVLESLKYKEDAWYNFGLKYFYKPSDFSELLIKDVRSYGYRKNDRDSSVKPFTKDDPLTKRLKQEKFMTAQFCWWKREIKSEYPEVWRKMEERFYKNYEWNWLVDGGEIKDYIPRRFLNRPGYFEKGSCYVEGVFPWVKLRERYGNIIDCLTCEKWYTLWDCNVQIFENYKLLPIPKNIWSYSTPTYHNTNLIWSNIKDKIREKTKADYDRDFGVQ